MMTNSTADLAAAPSAPVPHDQIIPSASIAAVRDRFSSLRGSFVYLDAPGGTQTPDEVAAAVARVYLEASGNTGAPYATSRRLEALVDDARARPPGSSAAPRTR